MNARGAGGPVPMNVTQTASTCQHFLSPQAWHIPCCLPLLSRQPNTAAYKGSRCSPNFPLCRKEPCLVYRIPKISYDKPSSFRIARKSVSLMLSRSALSYIVSSFTFTPVVETITVCVITCIRLRGCYGSFAYCRRCKCPRKDQREEMR